MATKRILNLGAGVGSTTVFLLAVEGKIPPLDYAVFADTGEEPSAVYRHLCWLEAFANPPVVRVGGGKLGDDLVNGVHSGGQSRKEGRFTSIPAYTSSDHAGRGDRPATGCEVGKIGRQCTRDYKVNPIQEWIRRELFGLKPRQRIRLEHRVEQVYGLDDGEPLRIRKVRKRHEELPWSTPDFPLARLGWARDDCLAYLAERVPHAVERSACVFCPYRSAAEFVRLRETDPAGWARALQIDRAIRDERSACTRGLRQSLYLHRTCLPLDVIDLDSIAAHEERMNARGRLFRLAECEGMCGV